MVIEYSKDLYHNYLKIKEHGYAEESSYCIRMLEAEGLSGILKPDCRRQDDQVYYYYDITAKQSLLSLLSKSSLSKDSLKQLLTAVLEAVLKSYEYLLDEKGFLIGPETIYYNLNSGSYEICYLPGNSTDVRDQMLGFTEFLMNKVDYKDKEAVLLIYNLYAAGKEEGYAFDHMLHMIHHPNLLQAVKGKGKGTGRTNAERRSSYDNLHDKSWESLPQKTPQETSSWLSERRSLRVEEEPGDNREQAKLFPVMEEREAREEEVLCYPMASYLGTAGCFLGAILLLFICMKTKLFYNELGYRIDYSKLFAIILLLFCCSGYLLMKLWNKKNRNTRIITIREYHDPRQVMEAHSTPLRSTGKMAELWMQLQIRVKRYVGQKDKRNLPGPASAEGSGQALGRRKSETLADKGYENKSDIFREEGWRSGDYAKQETEENVRDREARGVRDAMITKEAMGAETMRAIEAMEELNPTCLLNATEPEYSCILKPVEGAGYEPITIKNFPFVIGKLKKNVDYCLEKEVISRYHAKITKEGDCFYITDLNSTNGTTLNKEALMTYQQKELKPGDEVSFANIRYLFILSEF